MTTGIDTMAHRIAQECEQGASSLAELQRRLANRIDGTDTDELLRDMQALDGVQQTLVDLATVLVDLAAVTRDDGRLLSEEILDGVRQQTLRARLSGNVGDHVASTVELF